MKPWATIPGAALLLAAVVMPALPANAEYIFLKNGRIIEGKIQADTGTALTLLLEDGTTQIFKSAEIMRTIYTKLHMGRVRIRMSDGSIIVAYIVDEDQVSYTLRNDLYSPKEYLIKRTEVIQILRSTPSVLQSRLSSRHVDLTWKPPSNPVKRYQVYLKQKGGAYRLAGESTRTQFRLTRLECGSVYTAYVVSVDEDSQESPPSNEETFTTRAGTPLPPGRPRLAAMGPGQQGIAATVAWGRASDSCGGPVKEYAVYVSPPAEVKKGAAPAESRFAGYALAGKTAVASFLLDGLKENVKYGVRVTSLDSAKNESEAADLSFTAAATAVSTKNRRPAPPFPVTCRMIVTKERREITARLYWDEARDPDGSVASYRVYRKKNNTFEPVGTVTGTDFEMAGLPYAEEHTFIVRAVDDRGAESGDSIRVSTRVKYPVTVTGRFAYLLPLTSFARMFRPGLGGLGHIGIGFGNFVLGAESGYLRFEGKTEKTRETAVVPFLLTFTGEFAVAQWMSIACGAAAGGSYNEARVSPARTFFFRVPVYGTRAAIEPMFGGGLTLNFFPVRMMVVRVDAEYRGIVEAGAGTVLHFLQFSAGAGVRF